MDKDRVAGAVRRGAGKVEDAIGDFVGDERLQGEGVVDQVRGTVQNAYGRAKDTAREYADQAGDAASQAYEQGRRYVDQGREHYADARDYAREQSKVVSRQVEESPLAAILIAGAAGYLLALLIHRRSS